MSARTLYSATVLLSLICTFTTSANINMETVFVGNPGNPGELSGDSATHPDLWMCNIPTQPDAIVGRVNYTYSMGKYEVTAGQYVEFLNAVAATDTYGLFNDSMSDTSGTTVPTAAFGCNIQRAGSSGSYSYSVDAQWAGRPVNFIDYWDALRFANWMHNGQPTGLQDTSTTEDGSYTIDGYLGDDGATIQRNPNATWALPTEDEWYKAAYHKNNGITNDYWDLPMQSNAMPDGSVPENELTNPDNGNNANFLDWLEADMSVGAPYWRTIAGDFENSESAYGTYDQGGNVREWVETMGLDSTRLLRGGSYLDDWANLHAGVRGYSSAPTTTRHSNGFRLAYVPEPTSFALLVLATGMILHRRHDK